jgi:chromate transporter
MRHKLWQIWWAFTRLGLTSFGGPTAHIGYFHHEFVTRRGWLNNDEFAQDNALCQLVPGPASSQLGMLIGARHAGVWGSLVAWLGFTTPSALIMLLVMRGSPWLEQQSGLIHGLLLGAACVVTQAVWSMMTTFCKTTPNQLIAAITLGILLTWNTPWAQMACLVGAAICGALIHRQQTPTIPTSSHILTRSQGSLFLGFFGGLVLLSTFVQHPLSILFQSGSLVFGGGHVVLPLLQQRLVTSGLMDSTQILSGYAAAQLLPGPLFAIGAYVGGVAGGYSWWQGVLGAVAIFLPGWLLIMGIMPWWRQIQQHIWVQRALLGVQAAVVGVLAATLWDPIMTHAIANGVDIAIWIIGTTALIRFKSPAWIVTALCAVVGLIAMRYL